MIEKSIHNKYKWNKLRSKDKAPQTELKTRQNTTQQYSIWEIFTIKEYYVTENKGISYQVNMN